MRAYTEREQWFINRIGKVVYRPDTGCTCEICKDVTENGLIIGDESHAIYLEEMKAMYALERQPVRYFDTREEVNEFLGSFSSTD